MQITRQTINSFYMQLCISPINGNLVCCKSTHSEIPSQLLPTQLPHHCKKGKFVMDPLDTDWMTTIILTLSGGRSDSFTTKAPCWSAEHGVNLPSEKKKHDSTLCVYVKNICMLQLAFFLCFFSFFVCVYISQYMLSVLVSIKKKIWNKDDC